MVEFDLARGHVTLAESGHCLVVPCDLLGELLRQVGKDMALEFGRRIGAEMAKRLLATVGKEPDAASVEEVLGSLAWDFALTGLGALSIERWGRALVMTVTDNPLGKVGEDLLAGLFEGAIRRSLGRETSVVVLDRSDSLVRLLVVSPRTAARVRDWLVSGIPWPDALGRLHGCPAGEGP